MATLNCQPSFGSSLNSFLHSREWTQGTVLQTAGVCQGTEGNDLTSPPPPHSHPIKRRGGICIFQTGFARCLLTQFEFSSSWSQLTHAARSQEENTSDESRPLKKPDTTPKVKDETILKVQSKSCSKKRGEELKWLEDCSSHLKIITLLLLLYAWCCVWVWHTYIPGNVRSEDNFRSKFLPFTVGPGFKLKLSGLQSRQFYPLSHLASPFSHVLKRQSIQGPPLTHH